MVAFCDTGAHRNYHPGGAAARPPVIGARISTTARSGSTPDDGMLNFRTILEIFVFVENARCAFRCERRKKLPENVQIENFVFVFVVLIKKSDNRSASKSARKLFFGFRTFN